MIKEVINPAKILKEAQTALRSHNATQLRKSLNPVWELNSEPDLGRFKEQDQARLLRYIGLCSVLFGRNLGDKDLQFRGIEILKTSIKKAKGQTKEKAKASLGYAYFIEGKVNDALKWINEARLELNSIVYLYNLIHKMGILGWLKKPDEALEIFHRIKYPIQQNNDDFLKAYFYDKVSSIYWFIDDFNKAAMYLEQSIQINRKNKNYKLLAVALNNAAGVYTELGQFKKAHNLAKNSFVLFKSIGNRIGLAHILDTEANTFFKERKYNKSLETVDLALEQFDNIDLAGKAEAMFLKIKVLLKLNKTDEAIKLNRELRDFVFTEIGNSAYEKFHHQLVKVIGNYKVSTNEAIQVNIPSILKETHIAFRTSIKSVEHIVVAIRCNKVDKNNQYIAKCGERYYFGQIKYEKKQNHYYIGTKNLSDCKIFGRVVISIPSTEWNENCITQKAKA